MTLVINDISPRIQYTAGTGQTTFPYPFPIFEDTDMVVDIDGDIKVLTTDYTVTNAGDSAGGDVVLVTAASGGEIVTIYRDVPVERTTDFQQNGQYRSSVINLELDRIVAMIQQIERDIGRAVKVSIVSDNPGDLTPAPTTVIGYDDETNLQLFRIDEIFTQVEFSIIKTAVQTATAGQTVFSVPEITLQTEGQVNPIVNGAVIPDGFTVSAGQVEFDSGLTAGDEVWFQLQYVTPIGTTTASAVTHTALGQSVEASLNDLVGRNVSPYKNVEANTEGALAGKQNIKNDNEYSTINSDLHTCWIGYGGHESFPNVIGSVNDSGAHYSGVLGYDNTTDALATVMWHFHGTISTSADHPTMVGGSYGTIQGGSYTAIIGGTQNNIVGGNYTAILGGRNNTINPASGAVISGGFGNINGGGHSSCGGGLSNLLGDSCDQSVIAGGGSNSATNTGTVISGGTGNSATADYANVTGGRDCEATGSYSRAGGRLSETQYGSDAWASGGFSSVAGSAQVLRSVHRTTTTNATESNQFLDGSSVKLEIPENSAWIVTTNCVATDGTDYAAFKFDGLVYRGAGSTAASPTQDDGPTIIHATTGAVAWSHRVTAASSGAVNIKATGEAGKTIRWVTTVTVTQVKE